MTIMEVQPRKATRTLWMTTIKPLLDRYAKYRERHRAVDELRALDPGMLKDIGIDRSEAGSIVHGNAGDRRRAYTGSLR
jgi:uncharacterized protein YjiS (DUF1127 family)